MIKKKDKKIALCYAVTIFEMSAGGGHANLKENIRDVIESAMRLESYLDSDLDNIGDMMKAGLDKFEN